MKINPFVILTQLDYSRTILTMPFGLKELIEAPLWSKPLDIAIMGEILFILFCSTMIVNILIVKALKYVSSFTASIYIFLLPITGSLITILMGLQSLSLNKIIAFILFLSCFVLLYYNLFQFLYNCNLYILLGTCLLTLCLLQFHHFLLIFSYYF